MLRLAAILLAVVICQTCSAQETAGQPEEILLWPDGAPGSEGKQGEERVRIASGNERVLSNVHKPTITPYLPTAQNHRGVAVIIAPGGGHRELWSTHEGHNAARRFRDLGIAAFVLKYRLAEEQGSTYAVDKESLADMQRAIRLVRSRGREWSLSPGNVGVMGFSAGGELAALAGMRFDEGIPDATDPVEKQSCRPDFQALIYPGRSARYEVHEKSPPVFIAAGFGDRQDISEGMAEVYLKYKRAGIPAELHLYSNAGHGFGVRDRNRSSVGRWTDRFVEWLQDRSLLRAPGGVAAPEGA